MISSLYKKHSITFFYLMLLLVFSHSFISAQTPDMPFNIYLKQASLKEFTAKIEQLSEYSFIYGEEVVLKHPITLDLKETPLTTILQTAFIKQDISFEITKHHIILKKTTSLPIKQHFTLNGNNFFIFSSNINPIDFSSSQIAICILSLPYLHTIIFIISEKIF